MDDDSLSFGPIEPYAGSGEDPSEKDIFFSTEGWNIYTLGGLAILVFLVVLIILAFYEKGPLAAPMQSIVQAVNGSGS